MKKRIFIDFDGVLFNTAKEAYAVSLISAKEARNIDEIKFNTIHYKQFLKYRYLVGPAWNYMYILKFLSKETDNIELKYQKSLSTVRKEDYLSFEISFFKTREYLKQNYFKAWLELNEKYYFFDLIKEMLDKHQDIFKIITTKDKATVKKLLDINGICFKEEDIYDKESFVRHGDKGAIIKNIIQKENVKESIFIDDSKKHLDSCREIKNLNLYQSGWGYVSLRDKNTFTDIEIFSIVKQFIG